MHEAFLVPFSATSRRLHGLECYTHVDVKRSWEGSVMRLNQDEAQLDLAPLSLLSVNLIVHQCFRLWEELSQFAQMVARCVNQIQLFSVSSDLFLERRQMGT